MFNNSRITFTFANQDKVTLKLQMKNLEPNNQRSLAAMILIGTMTLAQVVSLILNISRYSLLQRAAEGQTVTLEEATHSDTMTQYLALLTIVIFVGCVIAYIMWFYRAYSNLHLIQGGVLYTSQWAILAWFTPIVNFFRPQQIMRELYDITRSYLIVRGVSRESLSSNRLISWWWAFWISANIAGRIDTMFTTNAKSLRALMEATIASSFADVIFIIAGVFAILVIRDYSQMEDELYYIGITDTDNDTPDDLSDHLIQ